MRKAKKRLLGAVGLFAVGTMTVVAANIPSPGASALSAVTDTVVVRVVGSTPAVGLSSPEDGKTITFPNYTVTIQYENATEVTLTQTHVDTGETTELATYDNLDPDTPGTIENIEFTVTKYGKYIITAEAIGDDGVPSPEGYIEFLYLPLTASYTINPVTGAYDISVDDFGYDVSTADFYLDNELIGTLNRDELEAGDVVSASLAGKPSGTYTIMIVAKDAGGNTLYVPFTLTIDYTATEVPDAGAPDTGGLFQNLNISSEDYLTTGLIMFFTLGVVALGIIASGRKSDPKKRR